MLRLDDVSATSLVAGTSSAASLILLAPSAGSVVLDSYRQLLTQIADNGGEHLFARDGDGPRHLSEFSTIAQLLFLLEATGRIEIVGMPRLDRTQPGIHYTQIRVRLTPAGRDELEAEKQRQS